MLRTIYISSAFALFAASLFLGVDRLAHRHSRNFCLSKIINTSPSSAEWDIPPLSAEEKQNLYQVLSQKFTYYDKGTQAYVFISEDKKYILKLLKQQKLHAGSWLSHIPLSFNPYYQEALFKEKKRNLTFSACKTAFTSLKEETGLIYVHINNAPDLNKKVTLLDKNGKTHHIDLDETSFYVQKRAKLIYSRISELMHDREIEKAKNIITSVFSLLDFLGKTGVVDNDPILRKNFGLINDTAVQIDVGKLLIDPQRRENLAYKREVGSITHSFKIWIEKNHPELLEHFEQCLREYSIG